MTKNQVRTIVPLGEDYKLAENLSTESVAAMIHELRRIAWNGDHWARSYATETAANVLRSVGDTRPLPRSR